ncbi:MAG: glycosyltransferase family 2 protein, partial [Desulfatitalea sp.]|nr:glycosyltransferase family 2 protein [Desulfatitalea sp.]
MPNLMCPSGCGRENADQGENSAFRQTLVYRFRRGVRYTVRKDALQLTLNFPLKSVLIHRVWKPVLEAFSIHRDFVSFWTISSMMAGIDSDKIEILLNRLVRGGYLEYEGISEYSAYPFVSIIIPVRNRPDDIFSCLQSLKSIDYDANKLEIIVVDDASTDHTRDRVSQFAVTLFSVTEHKQAS